MTPTLVASRNRAAPRGRRGRLGAVGGGLAANEMLRIADLHAWYGESHVLHGVNMTVNEGEVVSLLGRNGAGRHDHHGAHSSASRAGAAVRAASAVRSRSRCRRTASRASASATAPRSAASSPASPRKRTCCCPPPWARAA